MNVVVLAHRPMLRPFSDAELADHAVTPNTFIGTTCAKINAVWHFDGSQAVRIGIPNPDQRSIATIGEGMTLREALEAVPMHAEQKLVIHSMELPPGAYYPRIARPSDQHPEDSPGSFPGIYEVTEGLVGSLNQFRSLMHMLDDIFDVVHPSEENVRCFGASIRNLLLLACTECETHWRSVLSANGYQAQRYSTNDFVKLLSPMRLGEYALKLQHCPWLPALTPFSNWDKNNPTKSLVWYDNYNAAKHDREANFPRATLMSAMEAVAAVWIMLAASYGIHGIRHFQDIDRYFVMERAPRWRFSEVYTFPYTQDNSSRKGAEMNFPF